MQITTRYPTAEHEQAAQAITEFFSTRPEVEAVILMGSCARGKASGDSCLDILVLVPPQVLVTARAGLEQSWSDFYAGAEVFRTLRGVGRYSHVDLEFIAGRFVPQERDWTSGPDEFELEIGNTLVYSVALWEGSDYLARLKTQWLPYYGETLRRERLAQVLRYCRNNLDHIPLYVDRGLYFQSFHRLYDAFREFLQALFISRCTYPIAYDKWIREQIEEILGLPELYPQLPKLLEIQHLESPEIARKAEDLAGLLQRYVQE